MPFMETASSDYSLDIITAYAICQKLNSFDLFSSKLAYSWLCIDFMKKAHYIIDVICIYLYLCNTDFVQGFSWIKYLFI